LSVDVSVSFSRHALPLAALIEEADVDPGDLDVVLLWRRHARAATLRRTVCPERVGQTVHDAASPNPKLLILLRAQDGTSVASDFLMSEVDSRQWQCGIPIRSSRFIER
jgi:hypothetical protein